MTLWRCVVVCTDNLKCFQREGPLEAVPGCSGDGHVQSFGEDHDYCYSEDTLPSVNLVSAKAGATYRVVTSGGRKVTVTAGGMPATSNIQLHAIHSDIVIVDATAAKHAAACTLQASDQCSDKNAIPFGTKPSNSDGFPRVDGSVAQGCVGKFPRVMDMDVVCNAEVLPVGTITIDGYGELQLKTTRYGDTVRVLNTVPITKIFTQHPDMFTTTKGDDTVKAHNMNKDTELHVSMGAGVDKFYAMPIDDFSRLYKVFVDDLGDSRDENAFVADTDYIYAYGRHRYDLTLRNDNLGAELKVYGSPERDDFLLRHQVVYQFNEAIDNDNPLETTEAIYYQDDEVEFLRLFGRDGDDHFMVDTTGDLVINLYGEDGDDMFVFGQVYDTKRDGFANLTTREQSEVDVRRTSMGYLSTGNKKDLTAHGMDGNDAFYVQSNKGQLQLTGDAGNDYFSIRSFLLEEEGKDPRLPKCETSSSTCERNTTEMVGAKDDDYMQYDANAPVAVDGGEGFNTLVIIGTGIGDTYVIDQISVFGAGRTTEAINIQRFVVASQEGDDKIYLLSSSPYCTTTLAGGRGSDSFFLAPPLIPGSDGLVGRVLAVDAGLTLGQSGILRHTFDEQDYSQSALDKVNITKSLAIIDGVHAFAMDRQTISIVLDFERVNPELERTLVWESGAYISNIPAERQEICYTLRLSAATPETVGPIKVVILIPKTMEKSLPIFNAHDAEGVIIPPTLALSHQTATRVCLRPNPAAFADMNPDLSNHGERYVAISHQTADIETVRAFCFCLAE